MSAVEQVMQEAMNTRFVSELNYPSPKSGTMTLLCRQSDRAEGSFKDLFSPNSSSALNPSLMINSLENRLFREIIKWNENSLCTWVKQWKKMKKWDVKVLLLIFLSHLKNYYWGLRCFHHDSWRAFAGMPDFSRIPFIQKSYFFEGMRKKSLKVWVQMKVLSPATMSLCTLLLLVRTQQWIYRLTKLTEAAIKRVLRIPNAIWRHFTFIM